MSHAADDGAEFGDRVEPGSRVGNYVVERFIAAGGMGAVYEARHATLGHRVAVKVIRVGLGSAEGIQERFLREAQAAATVKHPNVVAVTDFGLYQERPYMVMEYLVGQSLLDRLRSGPMGVEEVVRVIVPIAAGLAAVHGGGVVHRDVKPENILIEYGHGGEDLRPKLIDFGIAYIPQPEKNKLTRSGLVIGTRDYMAPEQFDTKMTLDGRVDQYALAAVTYECLAGRKPVVETDEVEALLRIREGRYPLLTEIRPKLPRGLAQIVQRGMEAKRDRRYPDICEFGRELSAYGGASFADRWAAEFRMRGQTGPVDPGNPVTGTQPPTPPESSSGQTTHDRPFVEPPSGSAWRPMAWATILGLGIVAAAVGAGTFAPRPDTPPSSSSPSPRPEGSSVPGPAIHDPRPLDLVRSSTDTATIVVSPISVDPVVVAPPQVVRPGPLLSPSAVRAKVERPTASPSPSSSCPGKTGTNETCRVGD